MSEIDPNIIKECLLHTMDNELDILRSSTCVCAACKKEFSAREVIDWTSANGKNFALCPYCGMAGLVGDAFHKDFSPEFVKALNAAYTNPEENKEYGFEGFYRFCDLYDREAIANNERNFSLFLIYAMILAKSFDDDRFVPKMLNLMALGFGSIPPAPDKAIELAENPIFRNNPKVMAILSTLYFQGHGKGSEAEKAKKSLQYATHAACYGDIGGFGFLGSLIGAGVGCEADPDVADAVLDGFFPTAITMVQNLKPNTEFAPLCFYFYQYAVGLYNGEEDEEDLPLRDILRYLLIAKQCFNISGLPENDMAYVELLSLMEEVGRKYAPNGFDPEIYYDEHSFYDTFVDSDRSLCSVLVEKVEYDAAEKVLHVTVAPYQQYILLDTSSCQSRVVAKERVSFHFNGVISAYFPNEPFSFNNFATPSDRVSTWQLLDGLEPVLDIEFDPVYMQESE